MSDSQLVLEAIVSTLNADRSPNISPMGPAVDRGMRQLLLRPYQTSRTYQNLKRTGQGVLHVTDDVDLLARAAVGKLDPLPRLRPAAAIDGVILEDACRWYAFRVRTLDDRTARVRIECEVVDQGRHRDFFGFNRAKHAVVEAAILATRVHLLPADEILTEFSRLAIVVAKTAGNQELEAFRFLEKYVKEAIEDC